MSISPPGPGREVFHFRDMGLPLVHDRRGKAGILLNRISRGPGTGRFGVNAMRKFFLVCAFVCAGGTAAYAGDGAVAERL